MITWQIRHGAAQRGTVQLEALVGVKSSTLRDQNQLDRLRKC
jgi:hypothetical protein